MEIIFPKYKNGAPESEHELPINWKEILDQVEYFSKLPRRKKPQSPAQSRPEVPQVTGVVSMTTSNAAAASNAVPAAPVSASSHESQTERFHESVYAEEYRLNAKLHARLGVSMDEFIKSRQLEDAVKAGGDPAAVREFIYGR